MPCQRHDIQQVSIFEHNQNLRSSNKHISSIYILQDKKACFTGIGTVYIKYKQISYKDLIQGQLGTI